MKPHHPAGVEDRADDQLPVALDLVRLHAIAEVAAVPLVLLVGVGSVEVLVPGHGQVLHAHLEDGRVNECRAAQHDGGAADRAAQRPERTGGVDPEGGQLADVVRLAHETDPATERDDLLILVSYQYLPGK